MGLSFHYNGRLKADASLNEMVDEVTDLIGIFKWEYYVFEEAFLPGGFDTVKHNYKMYGICFTPQKCETVWLCCLSNGRLSNPVNLQCYGNSENKKEQEYLYLLSVKTQYAGIRIHKLLIHLFKYLSRKYFSDFTLNDEGGYWETGNEKLLKDTFERYSYVTDGSVSSTDNEPLKPGETYEAYFERILKEIHKK